MFVELMTCLVFVLQGWYSVCGVHDLFDVCLQGLYGGCGAHDLFDVCVTGAV